MRTLLHLLIFAIVVGLIATTLAPPVRDTTGSDIPPAHMASGPDHAGEQSENDGT